LISHVDLEGIISAKVVNSVVDADFIPAINLVRKNGKRVINAFFPKSSSYQLRNCCDGSINLRKALNKK